MNEMNQAWLVFLQLLKSFLLPCPQMSMDIISKRIRASEVALNKFLVSGFSAFFTAFRSASSYFGSFVSEYFFNVLS